MSRQANALNAAGNYASVGLRTDVETASPHRLILLLLDGALEKLRTARLAMQHGNIADKGAQISWAISIIDGLRASLDIEQGGEVASNLDRLYDYMGRTLVESNLHDDPGKIDEVERLLSEIRVGWKGIEHEVDGPGGATAENQLGSNAVART
jgi:flagellar protein FliS